MNTDEQATLQDVLQDEEFVGGLLETLNPRDIPTDKEERNSMLVRLLKPTPDIYVGGTIRTYIGDNVLRVDKFRDNNDNFYQFELIGPDNLVNSLAKITYSSKDDSVVQARRPELILAHEQDLAKVAPKEYMVILDYVRDSLRVGEAHQQQNIH